MTKADTTESYSDTSHRHSRPCYQLAGDEKENEGNRGVNSMTLTLFAIKLEVIC